MALAFNQVNIRFNLNNGHLKVVIETPRLYMRSIEYNDLKNYVAIFSNPQVMKKYANGYPILDVTMIEERVKRWVSGWESNDPFNGLAVFAKRPNVFIGHIVVGASDEKDTLAELAYIFHKKFWGKHLGSEAAEAIVNYFIPQILLRGYSFKGQQLDGIIATARVDNVASQKMLKKLGFKISNQLTKVKWGNLRYTYYIKTSALLSNYQYKKYR